MHEVRNSRERDFIVDYYYYLIIACMAVGFYLLFLADNNETGNENHTLPSYSLPSPPPLINHKIKIDSSNSTYNYSNQILVMDLEVNNGNYYAITPVKITLDSLDTELNKVFTLESYKSINPYEKKVIHIEVPISVWEIASISNNHDLYIDGQLHIQDYGEEAIAMFHVRISPSYGRTDVV